MTKLKKWAGIVMVLSFTSFLLSSCSTGGKYACPSKIEVLP
ncbi:MAG TPA: hypothetical protein VK027_07290 [Chitinophagaceae bacterium]|nr:hypothetical protein [Chitinophagaceae bacterium]